ncbi:MAG: TonB-dependent receptor [Pseudomonadota bacterium]|nr:TonB-dependent receptor [Pseudomonadota bacterium]
MRQNSKLVKLAGRLLSGAALGAIATGGAMAQVTDEIVVTSQRQEQSLQDVPIAVTALGGGDLQDRQIEGFSDIQFNTPNLTFTKNQFTSSTITIRGVAQLATASTSTASVSIHQNDVPQLASRIFETEFYDVERIEILRGPQGTLFGRNATGGVLNVITAKATPEEVSASAELQYGSFEHIQVKGHVNLPITDTLAVRVAGTSINRDGYTDNVYTGNDIDDRDLYSIRGSLRWYPTENTTIDAGVSYFREDDHRTSFQKVRCNSHPILGCATGLVGTPGFDELGFDQSNLNGTIASIASTGSFSAIGALLNPGLASLFGQYGLFPTGADLAALQGLTQPTNLRQVAYDFDPLYKSDELFVSFNLKHDFENFTFKLNGGYGDTLVNSIRDTDSGVGPMVTLPNFLALPNIPYALSGGMTPIPNQPGLAAFFANGLPTSALGSNSGIISGTNLATTNNIFGAEQSIGTSKYYSIEGIVASDFDGRFNFLLGANFIKDKSVEGADFNVSLNGLDYFSVVAGTLVAQTLAAGGMLPPEYGNPNNVYSFYSPAFVNDSLDSELKSISVFGEVYVDITDTLKLTGGVRYNNDDVSTFDRNPFLGSFSAFVGGAPIIPVVQIGTTEAQLLNLLDPDPRSPNTPGAASDFELTELSFDAITGRAVLQWEPVPGQNLYASWSRGFKPGGVNPASTGDIEFSPTYDNEIVNAYEVGAKLVGFNGMVRANLAGFYYDYSGLQVTNIIGLTAVNDNVDAKIYGVEGEFVIQPTDDFRMNLMGSYLHTEFQEIYIVDPANPAGFENVDVYRDLIQGLACVVDNNGLPSLVGQTIPGYGTVTPYVPLCSVLSDVVDGVNASLPPGAPQYEFMLSGVPINLDGNRLPQSPKFSFAVGAEYDFHLGNDLIATPRVDYYYQDSFYASQFNRVADLVDGYGNLNLQVTFGPREGTWYFRMFAQNVLDKDNISGQFTGSQGQGTFVNQTLLEPRRWGGAIGFRF